MSWLVMVWTSLIIARTSIADAAKEVYVDRTDVVDGMLGRENMLDLRGKLKGLELRKLVCRLACLASYDSG